MVPVAFTRDAFTLLYGTITLVLGGILTNSEGLIGQLIPPSLGNLGPVLQGGAMVVLSYGFVHLLTRTIPMLQRCNETQQKAFMKSLDAVANSYREDSRENRQALRDLAECMTQLRIHCTEHLTTGQDGENNP